ncbi:MAG: BMP family ABC transporter substrate-binding protein [Clostridia bacterium]|nr:BMP family ABC transporter substrate-binding protein [Clostridia bacterium]
MKKLLTLVLAFVLACACTSLVACGDSNESEFKVGFIFLHDESSTYDLNFIEAAKDVAKELGLKDSQVILRTNVEEGDACYDTAAELADQGCDVIFADSFGHESYMIKAAKEFKDVQFYHATGTRAHTEEIANYHNAFAAIYEGRYLAGIAAGMKLNEMIEAGDFTAAEAKMGYVGAFPYAEVVSGYTSFYLGAKSVCPTVTMEVRYTNSWYNLDDEKATAEALISNGCKLISQHADSLGAPSACEEHNVPNISYNGSTKATGPNTYIVSSKINWRPYMKLIIEAAMNNETVPYDWTGTIATGSVQILELNTAVAAAGTQEAIDAAIAQFAAGTLHVFDTSTFTVNSETLTSYLADVDDLGDFVGETEVISGGYFHESEYRSAPYFDLRIDGITEVNS